MWKPYQYIGEGLAKNGVYVDFGPPRLKTGEILIVRGYGVSNIGSGNIIGYFAIQGINTYYKIGPSGTIAASAVLPSAPGEVYFVVREGQRFIAKMDGSGADCAFQFMIFGEIWYPDIEVIGTLEAKQ